MQVSAVCRHRSTSSLEKPCGAFLLYGDRVIYWFVNRVLFFLEIVLVLLFTKFNTLPYLVYL
jgi:hypothetical protein